HIERRVVMKSKLIAHIATLALATLRSCARPHLWRAALVTALCVSYTGVTPTARAQPLFDPSFTEVVNVSANPGNSNHAQIASTGDKLFTVWEDGVNVLYRWIEIINGTAIPDPLVVNITNIGTNAGAAISPQIATDPLGGDNNVYLAWTQT